MPRWEKKCAKRRVLERDGSVASEGEVFIEKKTIFYYLFCPAHILSGRLKKKKRKRRRRIGPVFHITIPPRIQFRFLADLYYYTYTGRRLDAISQTAFLFSVRLGSPEAYGPIAFEHKLH